MTCSASNFADDKQSLVELVQWYRDEHHKADFGHSDMIEEIRKAADPEELEIHYATVDRWLDGSPEIERVSSPNARVSGGTPSTESDCCARN